ncbi:Transposase IS4 [Popillia japonica]|uniref:Transposase IS4 n=1 Tax=Popillia japonica TaxID=7064 RepID=A0AAW1L8G1_POPJA
MSTNPKDWLRWFEELEEEEEDDGCIEDSSEVSDEDKAVEYCSDTEENDGNSSDYYLEKDKLTKWRKTSTRNVRTKSLNIVLGTPGPIGDAKSCKDPVECLKLFTDDKIITAIVTYTNIYIESRKHKYARERDAKLTSEEEIMALLELLFIIGSCKSGRQNILDLWDQKGFGMEVVYLTMSYAILLTCLRFDNYNDRNHRLKMDNLGKIREVLDCFISNFQKSYTSSEYLTLDEQLIAF